MIYKEEKRDLFSVSYDYYLAHCISADFALGAGIAVQFNKRFDMRNHLKTRYPDFVEHYHDLGCNGLCLFEKGVFNLVTKERFYQKPTLESMRNALMDMKKTWEMDSSDKIAMPTIGAGLDRLNWNDVSNIIKEVFEETDVEILVCKL